MTYPPDHFFDEKSRLSVTANINYRILLQSEQGFLLLFCFYWLWSINKFSCYWIKIQSIPSVQKRHSCQNQSAHRYRQTSTHMHMRGYILHYHRRPVQLASESECDTTYISWELHPPLSSTKLPLHKVTLELMGHSIKQPVLPIICPKSVKYILNPNCT